MSSFDPYGLVSMKRSYSYGTGWSGEMVYCLRQSDVRQHIVDHWQDTYPEPTLDEDDSQAGPQEPLTVVDITDEPWMVDDLVQSADNDPLGIGGQSYSRKLTYHFGLMYLNVPWPDAYDQPVYIEGTTLKLAIKSSGQFLTLPAAALAVKGASSQTPQGQDGRLLIPINDFMIEWDRVTDLSALDFDPYVGKVNSLAFMGCEPETLLLETADITPSFIIDPVNGPWAWKVVCNFKRRRIVIPQAINSVPGATQAMDGDTSVQILGWNHEFRGLPIAGWQYILMQSAPGGAPTPRYQPYDFTDIFNATGTGAGGAF